VLGFALSPVEGNADSMQMGIGVNGPIFEKMTAVACSCLARCCPRRFFSRIRTVEARAVQAPLNRPSSPASPHRAQLSPRGGGRDGYESDFFDARSEVSIDDLGDHELTGGAALLDHCSNPTQTSARMCVAEELLQQLRVIERRCRGSEASGCADIELYPTSEADGSVECLLREDATQFWVCRSDGSPMVTACAYFRLKGVAMEDAIKSIRIPKERLKWDGKNLKELEIIGDGDIEDAATGQIVRCVVAAPRPLKDREMLQRRWQLPLPGGGQAFVLRSFDDDVVAPLRPSSYVRAFTHLSGYILRPFVENSSSGVELTMISRVDVGGMVPNWVQNLVRRFAKRDVLKFAQLLHQHCEHLASIRAGEAAREARASQLRAAAGLRAVK